MGHGSLIAPLLAKPLKPFIMYDIPNYERKTWEEDNYFGGGLPDSWFENDDDFEPPYDEEDE